MGRTILLPLLLPIGGQWARAVVLTVPPGGEMVQRLKRSMVEAEHLVNGIIKKAADAGGAPARRFGFEVEHLADESRLPKQPAVKPRPMPVQRCLQFGNHAQGERTVAGNVLVTTHLCSQLSDIPLVKEKERKSVRASRWRAPRKMAVRGLAERGQYGTVSDQHIQPGRQAVHTMHEHSQMNGRGPRNRVPRHGEAADVTLDTRDHPAEHGG